jgi:hypothetical protein
MNLAEKAWAMLNRLIVIHYRFGGFVAGLSLVGKGRG